MELDKIRRCGVARAGTVAILAGLAGACAQQSEPAPVVLKGSAEPIVAPMPAPPPALQVIVQRGQTLDGFAYSYHVPRSAIIAANGMRAPYELRPGSRLTIPSAAAPARQAVAPIAPAPMVAQATPLPPPRPETLAPPPRPAPPLPPQQQAALPLPPSTPQNVAPPAQTVTPPPSAARVLPEIIPLDGPPPPKQTAAAPPPAQATLTPPQAVPPQAAAQPVLPPRNPAAALPLPGEASPAEPATTADSGSGNAGGRFPWPVRGRVLASYGNTPGGGHNDGINIAAPRGTPVRAVDGGTVAYAGNEVKGYGNIVLIKHANGWISAYAHLDDVTVKPGDTIAIGQVIAKVGDSGGVGEPQLHFELRRGKKPVDPKEFLAPAPSAEGLPGNKAG